VNFILAFSNITNVLSKNIAAAQE